MVVCLVVERVLNVPSLEAQKHHFVCGGERVGGLVVWLVVGLGGFLVGFMNI